MAKQIAAIQNSFRVPSLSLKINLFYANFFNSIEMLIQRLSKFSLPEQEIQLKFKMIKNLKTPLQAVSP